jgi:hypothetical protein
LQSHPPETLKSSLWIAKCGTFQPYYYSKYVILFQKTEKLNKIKSSDISALLPFFPVKSTLRTDQPVSYAY